MTDATLIAPYGLTAALMWLNFRMTVTIHHHLESDGSGIFFRSGLVASAGAMAFYLWFASDLQLAVILAPALLLGYWMLIRSVDRLLPVSKRNLGIVASGLVTIAAIAALLSLPAQNSFLLQLSFITILIHRRLEWCIKERLSDLESLKVKNAKLRSRFHNRDLTKNEAA